MQPIIVLYLLWVVWFTARVGLAFTPGKPNRVLSAPVEIGYRLAMLLASLVLFMITPWPGFDVRYRFWDRGVDDWLGWVLVAAVFLGLGASLWATVHRIVCARNSGGFTDTGPYRIVRHPVHLGLIAAAFATAVIFGRPSSLAGAALLCVAFVTKIILEERARPLPDEYTARVPMLVPHLPKYHHAAETPDNDDDAPSDPAQLNLGLNEEIAPPSHQAPNVSA